MTSGLRASLIAKTLRVPALSESLNGHRAGEVARQLDSALLSVGFACSNELLEHLAALAPDAAEETGQATLAAVRELVGDHVRHNAYFKDFPANVPDTLTFWAECIVEALIDPEAAPAVEGDLAVGQINLLNLPSYGRYQHSYEELVAARSAFIASNADRVTVLHLGDTLAEESHRLYLRLASNPVPLQADELALLEELAALHVGDAQPERIDVRENRAVINRVRLDNGVDLLVDTPLDILRLACALSDGDVTLTSATRFRSLRRSQRRVLMAALDAVIADNPSKLADVGRYREPFKRLAERLHPHEFKRYPNAGDVFAVARGERKVQTLAGRVEIALGSGDISAAIKLLDKAPGMLMRSVDRLARLGAGDELIKAVKKAAPATSTRVLVSLREHLANRETPDAARIFTNQKGRPWVAEDERQPLDPETVTALSEVLDVEISGRLPKIEHVVVEPAASSLALPLSNKQRAQGIGIMPRGSTQPIGNHIRFFAYWKESERVTDYDLSVLMLDENFESCGQVSWTNLSEGGAFHSGDIVESATGASEFIDVNLDALDAHYVVPQLLIYEGEGFDEVEEAFFGFMDIDGDQRGKPFEPRTVRAKSDLFGAGRVALPVLFARGEDGWHAQWTHLNAAGQPYFNRVEDAAMSTAAVMRALAERNYLRVTYIEDLILARGGYATIDAAFTPTGPEPVLYLGLEDPENLPEGSIVYTPANLTELLA